MPSRTSGAEGGPGKRIGSNPNTAPRSDPYILGSNCRSAIGTLVERQTCYCLLVRLPDGHGAETVRDALVASITTLPEHLRRSLTWDQGTELAQHQAITLATDMAIYFCDPHSGTVKILV
jgi:IS30 family transposase